MKILKHLLSFYINSSIHVALAAFALTWVTLLQWHLPYDKLTLYFVFFASVTGYNFVKYFGLARFHHRSLANWLRVIQLFSFFAFVAMCYFALQFNADTLVILFGLAVVTFLYAIPLIPNKYLFDEQRNLRQISGLKVYVIAFVWTVTTVILPLVENNIALDFDVFIISIQRFCFVLVLMLPFEIRDLNYDSLKLATIPQRIGVKKTKISGVFLVLIFVMLEFCKGKIDTYALYTAIIIGVLTFFFLIFSNKKQSKYYSAFWVESIPLVWLVVLLVLG